MKTKKLLFTYGEKYQEKNKFTPETKIILNSKIIDLTTSNTRKIGELLDYGESEDKKGIMGTVRIDEKLDLPVDKYSLMAACGPEKINGGL